MFTTGKKALDYLENNELTQHEHLRLLGILNKQLNIFPLSEVLIQTPMGAILANGRELNMEELVKFRQGINAIKGNWAFQLLGDQILFLAIHQGVHLGDTTEKMLWSRTAIWFIIKFRNLITTFDIVK